jgi:hypothetical protein
MQFSIMSMATGPIGTEASAVKRALPKDTRDIRIRGCDHNGLSNIEGMTLLDLKGCWRPIQHLGTESGRTANRSSVPGCS